MAAFLTAAAAQPEAKADYPSKPIRFISGGAPGTVVDVAARQVADKLSAALGQPVIVENRPSAGGIVALTALKLSAPDGYAIGVVHFGQISAAPSLFARLPYDPVKDFTPVGLLFRGPQVLVVPASSTARTLGELLLSARSRPGQLRYASPGNGSPTHLFMEQLKLAAGVDIQHIPYKGTAAHVAVLGAEVDMLLEGVAPLLPHLRAGKLRALAVGGDHRLAVLPEVPSFKELGVADIGTAWVGVLAPQGTPESIVSRLNKALRAAVESPELRANWEATGREIAPGSPADMAEAIRDELPRWRDVVQRAHITAE
jgi:tripartite-type tricarboxylate transporter receptor subunit TctC